MGIAIDADYINNLDEDGFYGRVATIIVLCRYEYSRYSNGLDEVRLLNLLSRLENHYLVHMIDGAEHCEDPLGKNFMMACGRVLRETLAIRGDTTQYELLGESYLLGR